MGNPVRLKDAIDALAYAAQGNGTPSPVISTDHYSAHLLATMIESDIGMRGGELMRAIPRQIGLACMYNGVEIRYPRPSPPAEQGWREHFGPLAELMGY